MLQCRVVTLLSGWAGYKKTGLFLISYLNGLLVPSGACDDVGFFLYAPMMASFLNIGPLQAAFLLFTILIVVFMVIVGFSFLFFTQSFLGYAVIVIGLYRLFACVKQIADIYIVYMFVFITVPLLLVALEKKKENLFLWAAGLTGFVCAFANNMRILSALPVVLFFLIILVFNTLLKRSQKMIALGLFLVGYSIPYGHMQYVLHQRKVFLTECGAMPQKDPIQHTFWHNMYIGFGFLSNQHGITWHDGCGEAHARKVIPGVEVGSQAYEATIRDLIFNLIKTDRYFVLITLFTKLGVLLFFFLLFFGWLGLFAAYIAPKPWYIECAFLSAAGISALPGLLTLPTTAYLMGFITCTVLYTMYSLLWALNHDGVAKSRKLFKKMWSIGVEEVCKSLKN